MSGLDSVVLVLQIPTVLIWMLFSFFRQYILFLAGYQVPIQKLHLGAVCSTGCFWKIENFVSVFFRLKSSNCFTVKTHVFERYLYLYLLFVMMGLWIFACMWQPYYVMTSEVYIKVEHIRSWLLGSSFAKFQQFWSECFFSSFVQFISYCLQGPYSIAVFRGRVFHGAVWSRLEVFFFRLKSSNFFPVKTHVFGMSFVFCNFFIMVGLWICTCTCWFCQRQWPCLDQQSLHKNWTCQGLFS